MESKRGASQSWGSHPEPKGAEPAAGMKPGTVGWWGEECWGVSRWVHSVSVCICVSACISVCLCRCKQADIRADQCA